MGDGGPFVTETGPAFDTKQAAADAETRTGPEPRQEASLHALPEPLEVWDEERVRRTLTAKGQLVHSIVGVAERDWLYTEQDLKAIAAPLSNILNRYDVTRAAAGVSDELAVAVGFGGYAARSIRERRAMLEAIAAEPEVPVTGHAAPPGTGPVDDVEHQVADAGEVEWHRA